MIKNRCFDTGDNFSNTAFAKQENANVNDNMNFAMPGVCQPPIYECPQERCCHREIYHEVKHIVPVNTRVINHHIIHHTYTPMYTCCEENECSNVYDNKCGM